MSDNKVTERKENKYINGNLIEAFTWQWFEEEDLYLKDLYEYNEDGTLNRHINIVYYYGSTDYVGNTSEDRYLYRYEKRMIAEKYLDGNLNWLPKHKNDRPDLQRLVVYLVRLMENDYFLPYKDVKVREFFENRYHIKIGQNFECKRREKIVKENPYTFK